MIILVKHVATGPGPLCVILTEPGKQVIKREKYKKKSSKETAHFYHWQKHENCTFILQVYRVQTDNTKSRFCFYTKRSFSGGGWGLGVNRYLSFQKKSNKISHRQTDKGRYRERQIQRETDRQRQRQTETHGESEDANL